MEHAEGARAGATPCVDGLERVSHGVDGGPVGGVDMEQRGKQCRLGGGSVLIFVEQYVAVSAAGSLSDGGETFDELVCGDGEIGEFRHVPFPFGLRIGFDQLQQNVAFPRAVQKLAAVEHAARVELLGPPVEFDLPVGVGVFLGAFDGGNLGLAVGHGFTVQRPLKRCDETIVPLPDPGDGTFETGAAGADHGAADGVRKGEHPVGERTESAEILTECQIHVLVDDFGGQLQGARFAERLGVLVESDQQAILAHDGLEERIIGEDGRFEECAIGEGRCGLILCGHRRGDTFEQFSGGLAGKGQAEDAFGRHPAVDEGDDALRHGEGLAGTGARHHKDVVLGRRLDDGRLLWAGSECAHACLVSYMVWIWPAQAGQTSFMRQKATCDACGCAVMTADRLAAAA